MHVGGKEGRLHCLLVPLLCVTLCCFLCDRQVRKCPGAARIISYFHHMANLPMAIATSSSTELVR